MSHKILLVFLNWNYHNSREYCFNHNMIIQQEPWIPTFKITYFF